MIPIDDIVQQLTHVRRAYEEHTALPGQESSLNRAQLIRLYATILSEHYPTVRTCVGSATHPPRKRK